MSMDSLFIVTERKAESVGTDASKQVSMVVGRYVTSCLFTSIFLVGELRQEVILPSSISSPFEVHNHAFKGRPVSCPATIYGLGAAQINGLGAMAWVQCQRGIGPNQSYGVAMRNLVRERTKWG